MQCNLLIVGMCTVHNIACRATYPGAVGGAGPAGGGGLCGCFQCSTRALHLQYFMAYSTCIQNIHTAHAAHPYTQKRILHVRWSGRRGGVAGPWQGYPGNSSTHGEGTVDKHACMGLILQPTCPCGWHMICMLCDLGGT